MHTADATPCAWMGWWLTPHDASRRIQPPQDLPATSIVKWHEEPEYEHLDMIWADTAAKNIFKEVATLLKAYSGGSEK